MKPPTPRISINPPTIEVVIIKNELFAKKFAKKKTVVNVKIIMISKNLNPCDGKNTYFIIIPNKNPAKDAIIEENSYFLLYK